MKNYLVTGGAGFIGSHIAEALVKRGDSVRILDNFCTGFRHNLDGFESDVEVVDGDITDQAAVKKAVEGIDCIFHQAALASVPLSVENPMQVNDACVNGTLNVLDQARQAGVQRVVYAASSAAYGNAPFASNREADLVSPLSPYAVSKLAGEHYCHAFYETYGLETVCLRYFNVFGPRQDLNSPYSAVIPLFIGALVSGEQPTVYGDGQQTRDFTYVGNVVHANLLAAKSQEAVGKSINVADGKSTSLIQLLEMLNEVLKTNVQPHFAEPRIGEVRDSLADISRARTLLGYDPPVTLQDGLQRSIAYYQSVLTTR